ncbi:GTP cyclohydrolase II [Kitasatospora sp. GAS204B]|uniref:GTP cyclohydrolase II n=1 Tax=unclassified Kitasatospora TaxID=2633591 RepID=UPI0024736D76|nr:GTP cyclohydrolase II [Kitasatospora sp. GAS204B]MDH6117804.1 GTP cyclohydrolase II [Kitasatospora sp. GAS204B]
MTSPAPSVPTLPPPARVRTRVRVPLRFGDGFRVEADVVTFHDLADGAEHLALGLGDPRATAAPLVRVHSECLTGDVFGSARCDCGPQLRESVEQIAEHGGYLLYLRQEGRGIGLYNKLDAYALQDGGLDTYAANAALGLPEDARDYTAAAQMLHTLGAPRVNLLSNNPAKAAQLGALGITITRRVPTGVHASPSNLHYLRTKARGTAQTLGHGLVLQPEHA